MTQLSFKQKATRSWKPAGGFHPIGWLKSTARSLIVPCSFHYTMEFLLGAGVGTTPNPQPGGPSADFCLVSITYLPDLVEPAVLDIALKDLGDTQASQPQWGNSTRKSTRGSVYSTVLATSYLYNSMCMLYDYMYEQMCQKGPLHIPLPYVPSYITQGDNHIRVSHTWTALRRI